MRVCAYCRVSTDKTDQINSMQNQIDYFTSYINAHSDWEFVKIYSDEGISGTLTSKRIGFNTMINDCKNGKIDIILTKEVSRFARNTVDTLNYTRLLKKYNVYVIFINDNIDTRQNDGEFRLTIMAGIAQEESRKTSDRVKWGQKRAMEKGVVFGNNSLYGFNIKDGILSIDSGQAEIVKLIYHKFLNEKKGTHIIARELDQGGINAPKSDKWSGSMILRILRNEKYCGDLLQKKSITTDFITHSRTVNTAEDKIYIKDHHEAIIPRAMWQSVQTELDARSKIVKPSHKYWCSGKIFCANCGKRFIAKRKKNCDYITWVCDCGIHTINSRVLNACMEYVINSMDLDMTAIVQMLTDEINELSQPDCGAVIKQGEKKISELEKKKCRVLESYFDGTIDKTEMEFFKSKYDTEISNLKSTVSNLKNTSRPSDGIIIKDDIIKLIPASQNVYNAITDKIIIHDDFLEVFIYEINPPFRLAYTAHGYKKNYTVKIEER